MEKGILEHQAELRMEKRQEAYEREYERQVFAARGLNAYEELYS